MKSILFLSYDLPYPIDAGGKIRAYYLIRQLARSYNIHLLYFHRGDRNIENEKHMERFCTKIFPFQRRLVTSLKTIRYLKDMPFPAALYYDKAVFECIESEIKSGVDAIHFESFYTSMFLDKDREIPQLLGTENIEWRVFKEYANYEKNPIMKAFLHFEIQRIKDYEKKTWNKSDVNLAVSEDNLSEIKKHSRSDVYLVKNGVDIEYFSNLKRKKFGGNILFVGNFNYIQNQDAAEYLLSDIAPLLDQKYTLTIVGRDQSNEITSLVSKSEKKCACKIRFDSDIDDIRNAYAQADIMLAPLRTGSGTKFKILEAMASGVPVISTDIGAEGLDLKHERDILMANSPDAFIHEVKRLNNDSLLYEKLVKNAKDLVKTKYSWDAIGKDLITIYEKTLNHNR